MGDSFRRFASAPGTKNHVLLPIFNKTALKTEIFDSSRYLEKIVSNERTELCFVNV